MKRELKLLQQETSISHRIGRILLSPPDFVGLKSKSAPPASAGTHDSDSDISSS